jgi:hypothetical protein
MITRDVAEYGCPQIYVDMCARDLVKVVGHTICSWVGRRVNPRLAEESTPVRKTQEKRQMHERNLDIVKSKTVLSCSSPSSSSENGRRPIDSFGGRSRMGTRNCIPRHTSAGDILNCVLSNDQGRNILRHEWPPPCHEGRWHCRGKQTAS